MVRKLLIAAVMVLIITIPVSGLAAANNQNSGWLFPYIGAGNGSWDMSVGVFFGHDDVYWRNLQLRTDMDLAPGLRWHSIVRSNREMDTLDGFNPHFDENYLEGYGFFQDSNGKFSGSLRIGTARYLHFPYPDSIAMFDQVPGISDLRGGAKTGYSGALLTLDYAHKSGLGLHATGIRWGFGREGGSELIEDYLYYRHNFGKLHFESRYGGLAVRPEPLGRRETGFNVYLGTKIGAYHAGLLYEKLHNHTAYTGVMVTFPMDSVTKAMGRVAFDYDRSPEGLAMQIPLLAGRLGHIRTKAPQNAKLVGEVRAERVRTYWQNGQVRNYYEHRVSSWGETGGSGLVVVVKEQPWYLAAEALVSPHTFSDGFTAWEKDRQGPAQLCQKVVYQFYRL